MSRDTGSHANAQTVRSERLMQKDASAEPRSRPHCRFMDDEKLKVFRSLIKDARITAAAVEFELYVQPTQNVWWKYRQKVPRRKAYQQNQTVRIAVPQLPRPDRSVYTTGRSRPRLAFQQPTCAGESR